MLAVLGALLLPALAGSARPRERNRGTRGALASLLPHAASAAAVGARYLRDHPEERDAALPLASAPPREPRAQARLRRQLRRESARDFQRGAVVRVDGWVLSRTEARLCASVHLADHS